MTASRRDDGLIQMIEQNDEKHEAGHERLRRDIDRVEGFAKRLEDQVNKGFESLREGRQSNTARIQQLEAAPIDATKLFLNAKVVVAAIIVALGIAGMLWGLKSAVSDLASKLDTASKIQELQNATMKSTLDDMKRRQELQQYEIQGVKDALKESTITKTQKER